MLAAIGSQRQRHLAMVYNDRGMLNRAHDGLRQFDRSLFAQAFSWACERYTRPSRGVKEALRHPKRIDLFHIWDKNNTRTKMQG